MFPESQLHPRTGLLLSRWHSFALTLLFVSFYSFIIHGINRDWRWGERNKNKVTHKVYSISHVACSFSLMPTKVLTLHLEVGQGYVLKFT